MAPDPWTGPLLWAFWEVFGPAAQREVTQIHTEAIDPRTGRTCMPAGSGRPAVVRGKQVERFLCAVPEGAESLRLESELMGPADRSPGRGQRWDLGFDMGLDVWITTDWPELGAVCATPPVAEGPNRCHLDVVVSSDLWEVGVWIEGLDRDRREVRATPTCGARAGSAGGHLRVQNRSTGGCSDPGWHVV